MLIRNRLFLWLIPLRKKLKSMLLNRLNDMISHQGFAHLLSPPVKVLVVKLGFLHPLPSGTDENDGASAGGMVIALMPIWPGNCAAVLLMKTLAGKNGRLPAQ